jgi:hypothetical protein
VESIRRGTDHRALHRRCRASPDRGHNIERPGSLSSVALNVAERKVVAAYSPSVIAGLLRVIDFALIFIAGLTLYFRYDLPVEESRWPYYLYTVGIAATTIIFFQVVDIYQVHQLRKGFLQIRRLLLSWCLAFILSGARLMSQDCSAHRWKFGLLHSFVSV